MLLRDVVPGGAGGVQWHPQILADQLTLSQPGGTDYAHLITTGTPRFSDLPMALLLKQKSPKKLQGPLYMNSLRKNLIAFKGLSNVQNFWD